MPRHTLSLATALLLAAAVGSADAPPKAAPRVQPAAHPKDLKVAKDFKVELIYSVPKDVQGSWVSLCADPRGRIIVCDQYGGLFRVTVPPVGGPAGTTKVEKIPVDLGEAQGLLWAFDSLYVVVNKGQKYQSGLYRVRDTNNDGELDAVELLRKLEGSGEHGPHAVLLTPDRKNLVIVCGNATKLTKFDRSRVPTIWGEDHLLPRMADGRGFMRGVLGPGGAIYQVDPDGKSWELLNVGFRNQYDAAYNRDGELFTYDADMEWDVNTPWYRPTRINHVVSGADWGWRNGAGKYPPHYTDTLPATFNVGPGSPTGVCFGHGAKFPAKYQDAFYICDWSYGKLYALHLKPDGSSYTAMAEEFVAASPLPLTDLVVSPHDGAMYFAVGGRKTQSALYRVTYAGTESTQPAASDSECLNQRVERHRLESFHGRQAPEAVELAFAHLGHADRFVRGAARAALEWQPREQWQTKALTLTEPAAQLQALLALARVGGVDPFHRKPSDPPVDQALKAKLLDALAAFDWAKLSPAQRLDLCRVYGVVLNRFGGPDEARRSKALAQFLPHLPAGDWVTSSEVLQILVYLQAPEAAAKGVALLREATTQEEQIAFARDLRVLKAGWTPELRREYFEWFPKAAYYRGGASLEGFLKNIKDDAVATLTPEEKSELKPLLEAKPSAQKTTATPPRPFVKKWAVADLAPAVEAGVRAGRDFENGRRLFAATSCASCHRYDNQGGATGPDLTGVAGRFSPRDLLESIIEPSKAISDQYEATVFETADGKSVAGRIANLNGDTLSVMTDMTDPGRFTVINRKDIEVMRPSKVSMMPEGLLDTLKEEDILDLTAFLLSRGDRSAAAFRKGG